MSIVEVKDKNGNKTYKYKCPEWEVIYEELSELMDNFEKFVSKCKGLSFNDIIVDKVLLSEVLIRVDKRKDYFIIYHDTTYINEIKEAALTAYWLTKLKPFRIKSDNMELYKKFRFINEAFSSFILYGVIKEVSCRTNNMVFSISKEYNKRIIYGLKFWDLSKESLMLVAESLCEGMRR